MESPYFFAATLGLSHPWQITSVSFAKEERRLDIDIDHTGSGVITCPTCGKETVACDMENETWYHEDFFRYTTYLHARVPRIECACCGIQTMERPWSRAGSKFALIR
jgi:transposase